MNQPPAAPPAPFRFSDRHRRQIEALGAAGAIPHIEAHFSFRFSARPAFQPGALPDGSGLVIDDDALTRIGRQATALLDEMAALGTSYTANRLGHALAHWHPTREAAAASEADPYQEYLARLVAVGPYALAEHVEAIRRVAEAAGMARAPVIDTPRGRPAAHDGMIWDLCASLDLACDDRMDWREAWAPLAAPMGRLCRLVEICFEALGMPCPANLKQTVRRALAREPAAPD